ncbi:DUF932 domain-containing protein [Escherichia coli]|nr:DUF932 domain-containing protein [Escherichia coli]
MQQLSFLPGEMTPGERSLILRALKTLDRHLHEPGVAFTSTRAAREWLILNMAGLEREEFRVLYLNNQNQLIAGETLFTGTINRTEVHPREVIKRALYHNAAAVVLAHNHPSGEVTPSKADRRDRPLTHEELMHHVPGIFGEEKHTSRSQNYTYIPTITVLESLQREGFQPFFACQTRVRDPGRRGYTKHMLRLRRAGEINGEHVPEIILLNSHDGTSSYQMLPGYFRFVCQNGCVCGQSLGEVRVPHRGDVVEKVIEGAYEVVGVFDRIEEKRDAMQSLVLPPPARQALAQAALTYRYGDEHQPVTTADILTPRRREDYGKDLWSAYQTIQENMLKGGISGRSAKGKRIHTRAIHSIDTDIKLNRALWVMAETMLESLR